MNNLFTIILVVFGHSLVAQDCRVSAGTKTLYSQQQLQYTRPPAGYQPVFINHVGRHGARHLTKDLHTYVAYKMLMKADSMQALTKDGQHLKKMVLSLRDIELPYLKSISERGKQELESIASRMIKNNEAIIRRNPLKIRVEVTKEVRTSQSAAAFLKGIKQANGAVQINESVDDTALRFYDLSPAYLRFEDEGKWKVSLAALQSSKNTGKGFETLFKKFFISDFIASSIEKEEFCKDIYGFATIVPSIMVETEQAGKHLPDINFRSCFTCAELALLSNADEAEDFLLKGPGEDTLGIQVTIAAPLLIQFINTADEYIEGNETGLQLRFAHAETIAPFAALMQIKTASSSSARVEDFSKNWQAEKIIPLSANIQWIFYQKKDSKDYLVRFLLNEKEVQLKGLHSKTFPYYTWKQVRNFYLAILQKLQVGLKDNMSIYLAELK